MSGLIRRVATNAAWLASGEVVLKGALFLAAALVARGLGPSAMGVFTVAYGASLVLAQLLAAGQVEVVIREVASSPQAGLGLYRAARRVQGRLAWLLVPAALFGAWWLGGAAYRWALLTFLPYAWLRCRLITAAAVFKGLDRMAVEVVGRSLEVAVALLVLSAAVTARWPVWVVGLAFSLGALAGSGYVLAQLARLGGPRGGVAEAILRRQGLPFLGLAVVGQLLMRVDTFALAFFGVAAEAIGHYGAATTPVWGLLGVAQLLAVSIYPSASRAAGDGTLGPRHALLVGVAAWGLGAALAAALWVARDALVAAVFGPAYAEAGEVLAVVAWVLPPACGSMVLGVVVAALHRQSWALACQFGALVGAVAAYLYAVPRWALTGCAWTLVAVHWATFVATFVCALLAARRPGPTGVAAIPAAAT